MNNSKVMPVISSRKMQTSVDLRKVELSLEDVFINLSLISKIEIGDKLIQNDKYINIDKSYVKFFTRWMNGDNRTDNISFINNVLYKAFEYNEKLSTDQSSEIAQTLLRLNNDLKNCINGLMNLKQTYSNDKLIQSEIDVMVDNIRSKLNLSLKNINFNKL